MQADLARAQNRREWREQKSGAQGIKACG